jgi:hypothetical protein
MDYIAAYEFYKVYFEKETSKEKTGDCPLCEEEGKFSVNKETGQYRCFKCQAKGNLNTFLTKLHNKFLQSTTLNHYRTLAKERSLTTKVLRDAKWAFDSDRGRWLVPYDHGTKTLHNLGVFFPESGYRIFRCPGLETKLFRPFNTKKLTKEIWVMEGEWDALAAKCAFDTDKVTKRPSLVSTGGAAILTPKMNESFKGAHCTFFWDNDKGGRDGKKVISKKISGCTFGFIDWDGTDPKKIKDVRDLWSTRKDRKVKKPSEELHDFANRATVGETSSVSDSYTFSFENVEPVTSYTEYHENLGKDIYLNDSMRRSYEIATAASLSVNLPDKPIWLFLVGPASSGKSVLIESYGGSSEYFEYTSKLTAEALVSGWKGDGGDISMIPQLDGRTLMIGDLTVILNQPIQVQEKLWGLLRDAYQGIFKANFGNQEAKEYRGFKFCIVAGVTHAIYAINDSDMGERFLKVDFQGDDFDEDAHMDAAMDLQDTWKEVESDLKATNLGYYKHLMQTTDFDKPPSVPEEVSRKIKSLAKLTTKLRTKVQKDKWEGMIARPKAESPTRFATQLNTLGKSLSWVVQEPEVNPYVYDSLRKVAFDSCPGLELEVARHLHKIGSDSIAGLVNNLHIPKTRIHQIVEDFQQMKLVETSKHSNGSGRRGRAIHKFKLCDHIADSFNGFEPPPKRRVKKKTTTRKRKLVKA